MGASPKDASASCEKIDALTRLPSSFVTLWRTIPASFPEPTR